MPALPATPAARKPLAKRSTLLALGTLAAYTVMGASRSALAATTNEDGAAGGEAPATTKPVRQFNIPAGPLDAAVAAYEQITGLKVTTNLPGGTLAPFDTKGVSGLHTMEEALKQLLAGTGLEAKQSDATQPIVVGVRHSDTVDVNASLPDSVSMTRFTEPLLDTPQTIVAVPKFVLEDEGNTTLRDALRNVPGISMAAGESGAQGDNLTIRGFTARNDIFLDGIRDFGSYYRDSFDYEQVEVLEGPAGVQFGRGSTGGVINQESKIPQTQEFVRVGAVFGTDLTRRITADINQPLPDVANGTSFRLNAVATEGGVAGRPFAENRHYGVAPSLTFGLNSPTRYTVSYFHFTESDTPDYGLPWFFNKIAPTGRHNYFGFPDQNYLRTNDDIITGKVDHDFGHEIALHSIARWANYPRQVQITEPQICSNASVSVPVGGIVARLPTSAINTALPCAYTPASDPATIAVNRNQLQIKSVEGDLWDQTELTARFKLFGIKNNFAGGVEGGREVSNPIRTSYAVGTTNSVPSTNLLHPNPGDPFSGTASISSVVHTTSKSAGAYFVDTVHLGRLFELSGGVRWDYFDTHFGSTALTGTLEQVVEKPSYRAAFVYKPTQHGSIYFDYGTSFNPSAESLSLSVATRILPPEENETYEVGAKYSLMHDKLMLDGAWFHTTKNNARETDPTNSNNILLAGNQLVKGAQMSMVGKLPRGTDLIVGYAYLDSAVTYSKLFPASIGYPLANVPRQTFNFFVTHRLPGRFSAGFGGNSLSSRTASSTVPYVPTGFAPNPNGAGFVVTSVAMKAVPSYWVFNAMVKRPLTERIELQANVYNLTKKFYIDQPHPSHLIPGAGLSALIGANFRF